ncbi:helix-turn-helix domain-containing protein [Listeria innocua]|uniref:helix-turn-helix domain-containing protein n=2 Tax=Listeriaceae TaxID=186820 RepID=UPI0035E3C1F3
MVAMTTFERVKELCKKRGITVSRLEEEVGFGKNSIYSWKKNNPSSDKLQKVADYFNVSTDYLLARTEHPYLDTNPPEWANEQDILELGKFLESNHEMRYSGVKLTKADELQLKGFLEGLFWERLEEHKKKNRG